MLTSDKKWLLYGIGMVAFCMCAVIYINSKSSHLNEKDDSNHQIEIEDDNGDNSSNNSISNILDNSNETAAQNNDSNHAQKEHDDTATDDQTFVQEINLADADMQDQKKVGDLIYFRSMIEENYNDVVQYPALFRYQEGDATAERVNYAACYSFDAVGDFVYYLDSTIAFQDHGILYALSPDGSKEILDDELYDFQIVEERYIYYTYRHDTIGVGLEGHALQRMNLDGSEKMIAAYEVSCCEASGTNTSQSHFNYKVEDGWVDCGDFKMELGAPADGTEKIVYKEIGDNDYIYYVTNRLMKARKDGSEPMELDDVCDYWYQIYRVEGDWIYYYKGGMPYKIRTDGTGKIPDGKSPDGKIM